MKTEGTADLAAMAAYADLLAEAEQIEREFDGPTTKCDASCARSPKASRNCYC